MRQLQHDYPGAVLAENNSAIGGTGSWLGAFRTNGDALYGGAALVFVEFAVNDGDAPEQQVYASMEGIVRQIIARDASTDVVFLYTLVKNHLDAYKQGKLPDRVAWHEKIASHYGIPSVNLGQYAAEKILKGKLTFDEFAKDGVHPTDRGYAIYMEALRPFLTRCEAAAGQRQLPPGKEFFCPMDMETIRSHFEAGGSVPKCPICGMPLAVRVKSEPKPFSPIAMERAQCVPYQLAKLDDAWKIGQPSPVDRFMHVLQSDRPGATLTLRFQGSQVGYFDAIGPDSCDFDYSLDGGPWKPQADFDSFCVKYIRPHDRAIATGLDSKKWHELRLESPKSSRPRARAAWRGLAAFWLTAGSRIHWMGWRRWPGSTRFMPTWIRWTTRRPATAGTISTAACSGSAKAASCESSCLATASSATRRRRNSNCCWVKVSQVQDRQSDLRPRFNRVLVVQTRRSCRGVCVPPQARPADDRRHQSA